jgi:multicomponent K+:H+ antiporter subunit A
VNPQLAEDTAQGYLMVPAVLVRLLLPIAAVIAVYLFMRGHNEPGGGFVAGLVLSTAFILQYIVSGTQWVEANMQLMPQRWIAFGLLTATATGLGLVLVRLPLPDHAHRPPAPAAAGRHPRRQRAVLRHRRLHPGGRRHPADPHRAGPPVGARPPPGTRSSRRKKEEPLMEIVMAIAIGVLTTCGVWLMLRPRTYQVIMGLCLLGYGVNLFIFSMGRLWRWTANPCWRPAGGHAAAVRRPDAAGAGAHRHRDRLRHDRAVPGRAAAQRGFFGNDHVDGRDAE